MLKRPNKTDTEEDVMKMQSDFIEEKEKDPNFKPAAKFVRLTKPESSGKMHILNY